MHDNHVQTIQSRHRTSEGTVTYLRCSCGQFLVRIRSAGTGPEVRSEITVG